MSASRTSEQEQLKDIDVEKLKPGALKRLLFDLASRAETTPFSNHDSHVMFGSHESHGSHGQHTSHSSTAT